MTVCGGPREENPMCVEENPTGSDCCCPWPRKCLHHRCQLSRYGRDTHDIKAPVPVPPDQRTPSMTVPTRLMTIAINYAYK